MVEQCLGCEPLDALLAIALHTGSLGRLEKRIADIDKTIKQISAMGAEAAPVAALLGGSGDGTAGGWGFSGDLWTSAPAIAPDEVNPLLRAARGHAGSSMATHQD
jgi:hypothetical protein